MPLVAALAFPTFILTLALLMVQPLVAGLPADESWLLRVSFPFPAPFSAVIWFVVVHRALTGRRSRYNQQLFLFMATALLALMMLTLGVYIG